MWLLIAALLPLLVSSQVPECLQLTGSTTCPAFQSQYINPLNLSTTYPFFSSVIDVSTFDYSFSNYLSSPSGFAATKYEDELQCQGIDSSFQLQYARTFLCGVFTQDAYSSGCYPENSTHVRVCQSTCLEMATDEQNLISNTTACPLPTTSEGYEERRSNITNDFNQCTDWTAVTTNNTATCVLGSTNEPNCGFDTDTSRLCDYCDPSRSDLDPCCALPNSNTKSLCGYTVSSNEVSTPPEASLSYTPTSVINTEMGSGTNEPDSANVIPHDSLSNGQLAGVVIGSILGGILLFAFAGVGLALCWKRRRHKRKDAAAAAVSTANLAKADSSSTYRSRRPPPLAVAAIGKRSKQEKNRNREKVVELEVPNSAQTNNSQLSPPSSATRLVSNQATNENNLPVVAAAIPTDKHSIEAATESADGYGETNASSDGRNVVASCKDQYSDGIIVAGSEVTALYPYAPNLTDELKLDPETVVLVLKIFDDGWAVGRIIKSSTETAPLARTEGAFPLVVVSLAPPPGHAEELLSTDDDDGGEGKVRYRPPTSEGTTTRDSFDTAASHAGAPSSNASDTNWFSFSARRK